MAGPTEIVPGVIFFSHLSALEKEHVAFLQHNSLVLQLSGRFTMETSSQQITISRGDMLLIGKNQLAQVSKAPLPGEAFEKIAILLPEELLRSIALEEQISATEKYNGPANIFLPPTDFLQGYFQSITPYVRNPSLPITADMGLLKVKEGVKLLLHTLPALRNFLFDFSAPHKIDLEKFMLRHFHFNVPVEKFAQLTGRSLAGFKRDFRKTFDASPRQWLQEKRLLEARHLIETKHKKASSIYLDLGFESLSHFSHAFKKKFGRAPSAWT